MADCTCARGAAGAYSWRVCIRRTVCTTSRILCTRLGNSWHRTRSKSRNIGYTVRVDAINYPRAAAAAARISLFPRLSRLETVRGISVNTDAGVGIRHSASNRAGFDTRPALRETSALLLAVLPDYAPFKREYVSAWRVQKQCSRKWQVPGCLCKKVSWIDTGWILDTRVI